MAAAENLSSLLEGLRIAVESKSEEKLKSLFDVIVSQAPESTADAATHEALAVQLSHVLSWEGQAVVLAGAARAVAELAKLDAGREACAACPALMRSLLRLLSLQAEPSAELVAVQTQACRALGNICYENEEGRAQVLGGGEGLPQLIKLLERARTVSGEPGRQLRNVSAGFLLNLLAGSEDTQRKAVSLGALPVLGCFLESDSCDEEVPTHVLMILALIADSGPVGEVLDERLCRVLVHVMRSTTSPEVSEMCIELLHSQAENEQVKSHLATAGLCELLLELLHKHRALVQDDETRNLMKLACDLIVLVLTGDESMELLYSEGEGRVFKEMISWLEADDEDLQVTGVLAMGNFARTDKHCIHMVKKGVGQKLLRLVSKNNTAAGDIRLQHALLSALRNLVIPTQNKPVLLAEGLVETVLPMCNIPTFPVVFKLLGTLRMVIDAQEDAARELGSREQLLRRLVDWCVTEDHPGVQGEANRLLAWLVKNSKSQEVAQAVVKAGGLPHLVSMLSAEHAVMQNEAMLALALVAANLAQLPTDTTDTLAGCQLASGLVKFLQAADKKEKPMLLNALSLLQLLAASAEVRKSLVDAGVSSALAELRGDERVSHEVRRVAAVLDSG